MKLVKGIWLPDTEKHLLGFAKQKGWTYQYEKLEESLKWVKNFDVAIDIGAHCGLWSIHLVKRFKHVFAFEPIPIHQDCFRMNVPEAELIPMALGDKDGLIKLRWNPESTGDTKVAEEGLQVEMRTLDSFGIKPDFIKIDVEGWEMNILKGAEETLKHKPVVCVEQKPKKAQEYGWKETEAKDFLKSKGYNLRRIMAGDFIFS